MVGLIDTLDRNLIVVYNIIYIIMMGGVIWTKLPILQN